MTVGEQSERDKGKKTLVLDLDETLLHSSFKPITSPDLIICVESEGKPSNVYIRVRPGTMRFLQRMSEFYEIVFFTASMADYAKAVVDKLDKNGLGFQHLSREH